MDITNQRFQEYQEAYVNTKYAFEIAKNEFEKKYIFPLNLNFDYNWELSYSTNKLKIWRKNKK